ncbi:F420-0:Gamma-glutamyl ligase [Caldanaerobius fijiensis DSM 17918]|uniref:F420-0:Gamma-glutamyl ligase n=1 Tax=Caldanaerobius fijiensis DSM 17918 TaxID=1121256 RepID=A0A1M5ASN0_9THEO|nr:coenzyme F420-0:L-glutamate ligase [Caldanaerobius fijiensis]SHF33268.1 F420-0:Gamma-glutamyl ligase [Caldanaerobius fijiensis DSM 17918]
MLSIIPIRTHIITEKDDIVEVVYKYTHNIAEKGDLIAISESVVAITQGRAYIPETVKAGMMAKFLCRFPKRYGSLTSPAAFQLAIDDVGKIRILLGALAGGVGRLLGIKGWFFRVAGKQVVMIDDVAGTMPPYHRHIILGPKNPDKVCQAIKERMGIDAVIVDANDLGYVDVIGASKGVIAKEVERLLKSNPSGNYEQQTPIVIIKDYKSTLTIN